MVKFERLIYLSNATTKTQAFENLMKCQSSNEWANGANILWHSHSDSDDNRVKDYPYLQHLRHQLLLQPRQFFNPLHFTATTTTNQLNTQRATATLLLLRFHRRVVRMLHVRARNSVHQQSQQNPTQSHLSKHENKDSTQYLKTTAFFCL